MSLGIELLDALLQTGAAGNLRELSEDYFIEEELPTYQFIRRHFQRYGHLPNVETVETHGLSMIAAVEPFRYYLERVRERAVYNAIRVDHEDYLLAMRRGQVAEVMETLQRMLVRARSIRDPMQISNLVLESEGILEEYERTKEVGVSMGITLGWDFVDEATLGATPGDLVVVVGRPGMGKSYVMLQMAVQAWRSNKAVLFVSMEMPLDQITRRWVSLCSGIDTKLLRKGELSPWGEDLMYQTVREFEGTTPVHLMAGSSRRTVEDIREAAQYMDPDIIYVDAAYLLGTSMKGASYKAKWEKIGDVLEGLKGLSTDLGKPVVISVQFNREVRRRSRGMPDLSQIAGADVIPQLASIILGIQLGEEPHELDRRGIVIMKHREGEDELKFEINFKFRPVDLSEVDEEDEEEENWDIL